MQEDKTEWEGYARAIIRAMADVLPEVPEDAHAAILEAADYWLSVGLVIGRKHSSDAERLLALILAREGEPLAELEEDASAFCREALP